MPNKSRSRRLIVMILAIMITFCTVLSINRLKAPQPDITYVYKSGETISAAGIPIKIEGWNLLFNEADLRNYSTRRPGFSFRFELYSPGQVSLRPVIATGMSSMASRIQRDGNTYSVISGLPPRPDGAVYLHFSEQDQQGKITASEVFPVRFHYWTHKSPDSSLNLVYSEIELSPEQLKKIHDVCKLFSGYLWAEPPVYVLKRSEDQLEKRGGSYEDATGIATVSSLNFTKPLFEQEAEAHIFHELVHALVSRQIITDTSDQRMNIRLFNAYRGLVEASGFTVPMPSFSLLGPPDEVKFDSAFSAFDEGAVIKDLVGDEEARRYGHPFSNSDEFMASAATVMRYFPERFLKKLNQLPHKERSAAKQAAREVLSILKDLTAEQKHYQELIPQYQQLEAALR
jgi:hypothetical protein